MFLRVGVSLMRAIAARHPNVRSPNRNYWAHEPFRHAKKVIVPISLLMEDRGQGQTQEGQDEAIPIQGGVFQTGLYPQAQEEMSDAMGEKDINDAHGQQPSPSTPSADTKEQNKYQQRLNLADFRPENVKVTLKQRSQLCVKARQAEDSVGGVHVGSEGLDDDNFHLVKELTYNYHIPDDVDVGNLVVSMGKDGFLAVEAPRQHHLSPKDPVFMVEEYVSDEIVLEPAEEGSEDEVYQSEEDGGYEGSQTFAKPEDEEGRSEGDGGYGESQTFT